MTTATEIEGLKKDIKKLNKTVEDNHKTYIEPYLKARRKAEDKLEELEESLDISTLVADTVRDKYSESEDISKMI
jgi:hypothetical protein